MAELITIMWRDIPAQVTAKLGRRKASVQLSERFQTAIDRAAVVAGKHTTDDYLGEWHRNTTVCDDDLQAAVDEAASRLEIEFTNEVLRAMIAAGGYAVAGNTATEGQGAT